jgi:hypothetical protein
MKGRDKDPSANGKNDRNTTEVSIDTLLRQALEDDLPPDAEIVMKKQLERFRGKMEQAETRGTRVGSKTFPGIFHLKDVRVVNFLFKKEVLVVVSLLMVVLGTFIHSSGSSNKFSENLSVLGTSVVVPSQMSRSQSMECSIRLYGENEKPLEYSIQWISPNLSKIQVTDFDTGALKTFWLSEEDIVINDHVSGTIRRERRPAQLSDPLIRPIIGYLAPAELAQQMYGEWKLEQYEQQVECGRGVFMVALPEESSMLEVTIDLCSYLPITIKKILVSDKSGEGHLTMTVRYTWNIQISPEQLSPKPIEDSQKA